MKGWQGAVPEYLKDSKISVKPSHTQPSKNPLGLLFITIQMNRSDSDEGPWFTRTARAGRICQKDLNANGSMEIYQCLKKNQSVNWINHGMDFNSAEFPCIRSGCTMGKIIFFPLGHKVPKIPLDGSDP